MENENLGESTPEKQESGEVKPDWEGLCGSLNETLKQYQFFSDQVKFNSILYQGFEILLDKITKIESMLNQNGNK